MCEISVRRRVLSPLLIAFVPLVFFAGSRTARAQQQGSWVAQDIGYVPTAYTITAGGADIGDTADQFRFVYQQITGDVDLIARVSSFQGGDGWSKAGLMVRESLADNARHASALITQANGFQFLRRIDAGGFTTATAGGAGLPPGWVKLVRRGYQFTAFSSNDGAAWTQIAVDTVPMQSSVYVGLAVTGHSGFVTALIDNFSIQTIAPNQPPTVGLTSPANGAAYTSPANIPIAASASDPEGRLAKVEFFSGSTSIGVATSAPYAMTWSSVPPGTYVLTAVASDADGASTSSGQVTVTVAPPNQPPTVALTAPANGASYTAPASIQLSATASDPENRLARVEFYSGATLIGTDTSAPYAITWSGVPAGNYTLQAIAYDADGATATSSTVSISVAPDPLTHQDIGAPAVAGSATVNSGTYTISAGGVDIYGTSDQGHFVYQQMSGDVEVIARVQSIDGGEDWAKAGVMIRESLSADSPNAYALVSRTQGFRFLRRPTPGALTSSTVGGSGTAPAWLRLVRQGNQFSAYRSADGVSWTLMGTDTVPMAASVFVGLAVTAHSQTLTTTVSIDNLTVQVPQPPPANQPPTVALTAPANGTVYTAPASVTITASASDPENRLSRIEVYAGTTLLSTGTVSPYTYTWASVAEGTYALSAIAYDADGGQTQSPTVTITVNAASGTSTATVTFHASTDHDTLVDSYRFDVFPDGADPNTATPIVSSDLGKPAPDGTGTITTQASLGTLQPGTYSATVSAIGSGGSGRSDATTFTR